MYKKLLERMNKSEAKETVFLVHQLKCVDGNKNKKNLNAKFYFAEGTNSLFVKYTASDDNGSSLNVSNSQMKLDKFSLELTDNQEKEIVKLMSSQANINKRVDLIQKIYKEQKGIDIYRAIQKQALTGVWSVNNTTFLIS